MTLHVKINAVTDDELATKCRPLIATETLECFKVLEVTYDNKYERNFLSPIMWHPYELNTRMESTLVEIKPAGTSVYMDFDTGQFLPSCHSGYVRIGLHAFADLKSARRYAKTRMNNPFLAIVRCEIPAGSKLYFGTSYGMFAGVATDTLEVKDVVYHDEMLTCTIGRAWYRFRANMKKGWSEWLTAHTSGSP